jgi:hypothetical protein
MRVRTTIAGTARSVRLTAIGWGTLTLIASVVISGCTTSSSSTTPAISTTAPNIFSPTVTASGPASSTAGAVTPSPVTSPSALPTVTSTVTSTPAATRTATVTPTPTPTPTPTRTVTARPSASHYPTAAPPTGGGGTAGFQDTLVLVLGIAAILFGTGSIAYRRRLRKR